MGGFFWFIVIAFLISSLSVHPPAQIFLVAMAIVASTRVAAFYNEDLSRDLAKMIPFTLLGVTIIDLSLVNIDKIVDIVVQGVTMWKAILYYLLFTIALELVLRIITGIVHLFKKNKGTVPMI